LIAIVIQTALSLVLAFAVGFVTAWIVRGGREERKFQLFFEGWHSRYDQLERDCDVHLARISALQKELSHSQAMLGQSTKSVSSTASNLEIE
jgi:uncharacterized membrane-anchored protein YhcB (DUF1043 family)